ncbi:MAG TPA: SulP family inorganic anion transporter [Rhodopila sp.]|nr:SulP family inorganic anion transporter [Rhodopila sp.]
MRSIPTLLRHDLVAGMTLAAYAVPDSLAYATLAGLPPQVGLYGYMAGGLGYALVGSSRYIAVGPTSAISLMIGVTAAGMANGDPDRYLRIAVTTAIVVAVLCLIGWLLRLSVLVKLISDSALIGFKAGAGLTIAITQIPALLGIPDLPAQAVGGMLAAGGHSAPELLVRVLSRAGQANPATCVFGALAFLLLALGHRCWPGRPVALAVVAAATAASALFGLSRYGIAVTGPIPGGLPGPTWPATDWQAYRQVLPLATGCLLLAYIEGVAAARAFALKHDEYVDPRRELLGLGAANLATGLVGGYPVAGGLSQTAVNEQAGARSRLSLVFASVTLSLALLFLTGLLASLPRSVLAAVVLVTVLGLFDLRAIRHMEAVSRVDLLHAAAAFGGVLLLGILPGILLAVVVSMAQVLFRYSTPHVAFLGRIRGTQQFSDLRDHPENERLPDILAVRPEASLLYLNADHVLASVLGRLDRQQAGTVKAVVCDLSASPRMDLAGARMLTELQQRLQARGVRLLVADALSPVRALLRAQGLEPRIEGVTDRLSLADAVASAEATGHGH